MESEQLHYHLQYPVFLIEKKEREYTMFDIANSQRDFVRFSRVPAKNKYVDGTLFDSSGHIFNYGGSAGWPRFGKYSKPVFESLILPALLAKLAARFFYFGPRLQSARLADLESFQQTLLERLKVYTKPHEREELRAILGKAQTYEKMITSIDWWRMHGGRRDEDGHPIE